MPSVPPPRRGRVQPPPRRDGWDESTTGGRRADNVPPPPNGRTELELTQRHAAARSTELPGQLIDESRGRVYPCESCGADLVFHIGEQKLHCGYCGFTKDIAVRDESIDERSLETMLAKLERHHEDGIGDSVTEHGGQPGEKEVRCNSCGGTVVFSGTLTSTSCPYCGSPLQRDAIVVAKDRISVDGVLPFSVDDRRGRAEIASWVKSLWFAPNKFRREGVSGEIHSVYLPYWTFDAMTDTAYAGQRGDAYYVTVGSGKNRRTVRRVRWSPARGRFRRFFDDVLVVATVGLPQRLLLDLEPWPLPDCLPYTQQVIAGHLARTYDKLLLPGFEDAQLRIEAAIQQDVRSRIGGDEQRIYNIDTNYSGLTFKHLLLPVWMLAYRYGDKPYRVFVNGATGEVHGERPYSPWKIAFAVVLGAIAFALAAFVFSQQQ